MDGLSNCCGGCTGRRGPPRARGCSGGGPQPFFFAVAAFFGAAVGGSSASFPAVSPEGEVTRCLMDAHEHGQHPAWVMEQRQLRERQADAADGMAATAPDRPSLRQRLFPNR